MFLALKEMKKDKGRFALILAIVVLISYLVFFLTSLAYGLSSANRLAVDMWDADRIILQKGSNKNILSSQLEKDDLEKFKDHDVDPINLSSTIIYKNGQKDEDSTLSVFMMGFDENSQKIPDLVEGRGIEDFDTEIIGSISLKNEDGFKLGDSIKLASNDREYEIVGFTKESKFSVRPVFYTSLEKASQSFMTYKKDTDAKSEATYNPPKRISAIIVNDDKNIKTDDFDIIGIDEFIKNLPGYLAQVLTFALMIGFLIVIASIVLGVFMYIITMQKKSTFAILKIQGISNSYIGKSVIGQTLIVSVFGVGLGLGLTYLSGLFLPSSVPFMANLKYYLIISLLMVITTLLGAIFSVRGVSKIQALEALD